jgi:hypothetical protein
MASKGHWLLRQVEEFMDLAYHLYTFLAFMAAYCLVPGTIVLCAGKYVSQIRILSINNMNCCHATYAYLAQKRWPFWLGFI